MSKPKPEPSEFFKFCNAMHGLTAVDAKGNEVPKFLLFWHHECRNPFDVNEIFDIKNRPKNNQML